MAIFKKFRSKKGRKYPIKLDEKGKSARRRCFEMFRDNIPLSEIAEIVGVKIETVSKYHQQWRKNPDIEKQCAYFRGLFRKSAPDRDYTLELFAKVCGIQKERLETILSQPHGLRRLLTKTFYFPGHADADHKRQVALEVALLISDHLIKNGGKFEDVRFAFEQWMKESQEYRKAEDADIEEENHEIAFTRQVLDAAAKAEQQGQAKYDRLTEEERDAILKYGLESKKRNLEISYWFRIAELRGEGLTEEKAREKIYHDLLEKGDVKGAKMMRSYQDMVHPLKGGDQDPPTSPRQPPSPA